MFTRSSTHGKHGKVFLTLFNKVAEHRRVCRISSKKGACIFEWRRRVLSWNDFIPPEMRPIHPYKTNDEHRSLHAVARQKRCPLSGKSIDTICPRCVYIGVPAKKALQFFTERLQDGIANSSILLRFFSQGFADYNRRNSLLYLNWSGKRSQQLS